MWAVFSLHVGVIFPCVRGGGVGLLSAWGEGGGELLGLPPITIFARAFCCHIFYCTDSLNAPPPLPRKEKNKFPQKIETSTIWKKINICDVKKM